MKAPASGESNDWFTVRNVSNDEAEIDIYGQIGGFSWWDDDETVTAQSFRKKLKELNNKKKITVHINSPGGSVFEGLAIYNALKQHDATIRVVVDALAASAASFIAMAADEGELIMARNAVMMIHDAAGVAMGNAEDMRSMAELLDKHSDNIADIYAQRSGEDAVFWRTAMIAETWYTGSEAVEAGLADGVLEDEDEEAKKVAAGFDLSIFNFAGREQAPSPSVVHKKIKSMMNKAQEASVSGTPAQPKVTAHGDGTGTPPAEEQATPPAEGAPVEEEATPPAEGAPVEEEETGKDGDGQPVTGTQPPAAPAPENRAGGPFSVVINGVQTSDPRAIQAHITALETAQQEARDGSRKAFVAKLVADNKLPATQLTATEEFALDLSDAQYEKWTAQWVNAASLSLLAEHGGGSTNHSAEGSAPANAAAGEIDTLRDIIKHHKQGGRSDEFIKNTASYKTLIALQPDFQL
jgi:ATP-dependent Clp endopeptidase proteolytic subunit ClpP